MIIIILNLTFVNAVGFGSTDNFTSDGSSGTDAMTFENRDLDMTIQSSDIMVACYDWYKECGGSTIYQNCFAANQQDFDDCEAYDSWLTGMGYATDSTPETQEMDTSNESNGCIDARYYKNCDGSGGGNLYGVDEKQYWIFSRRWFDCDSGSPSWYTYDAEGYVDPYTYDYNDEISCPTNKKCSESDDDDWVYTYDGTITNPCRWDDDQPCSIDSDCWSNDCAGDSQERYRSHCMASNYYQKQEEEHYKCCTTGCEDPWDNYWGDFYCGSGYQCDYAGDDEEFTDPNDMPNLCKKSDGESCSSDSDCLTNHVCCNSECSQDCDPDIDVSPNPLVFNIGY